MKRRAENPKLYHSKALLHRKYLRKNPYTTQRQIFINMHRGNPYVAPRCTTELLDYIKL